MNDYNDRPWMGIRETRTSGYGGTLKAIALALFGLAALFIVARVFISDVYKDVGPYRSADITILFGLLSVFVGLAVLALVVIVSYIQTRMHKYQPPPAAGMTAQELVEVLRSLSLSAPSTSSSSKLARLPAGNWTTLGTSDEQPAARRDGLELAFADDRTERVTVDAWRTAMELDRLTRKGWPHSNEHFQHIRAYLLENEAISPRGDKHHERCHRLDRQVMAQVR